MSYILTLKLLTQFNFWTVNFSKSKQTSDNDIKKNRRIQCCFLLKVMEFYPPNYLLDCRCSNCFFWGGVLALKLQFSSHIARRHSSRGTHCEGITTPYWWHINLAVHKHSSVLPRLSTCAVYMHSAGRHHLENKKDFRDVIMCELRFEMLLCASNVWRERNSFEIEN